MNEHMYLNRVLGISKVAAEHEDDDSSWTDYLNPVKWFLPSAKESTIKEVNKELADVLPGYADAGLKGVIYGGLLGGTTGGLLGHIIGGEKHRLVGGVTGGITGSVLGSAAGGISGALAHYMRRKRQFGDTVII